MGPSGRPMHRFSTANIPLPLLAVIMVTATVRSLRKIKMLLQNKMQTKNKLKMLLCFPFAMGHFGQVT